MAEKERHRQFQPRQHAIIRPTPVRPFHGTKLSGLDQIQSTDSIYVSQKNSKLGDKKETLSVSLGVKQTKPPSVSVHRRSDHVYVHETPEKDTSSPPDQFNTGETYFQKINSEGFVTNVLVDNANSRNANSNINTGGKISADAEDQNQNPELDTGYQILSTNDEEAERIDGLGQRKPIQLKPVRTSHGKKGLVPLEKKFTTKKSKGVDSFDHTHVRNERAGEKRLSENVPNRVRHLLDVKSAIERLNIETAFSDEDSATSSSSAKSSSSLDSSPHSGHHFNVRPNHGSTTLNTTVTSADEFVWIDSHNRLVELQQLPWSPADILKVIHAEPLDGHTDQVDPDLVPRLSYYLQRVLVRLAREAQRLSKIVGKCGSAEIGTAIQVVLSPGIAISVTRACLRSSAMFAISSEVNRHSKTRRAGLIFNVGKMFQWMCLVKIGRFIQEESAVYLTAAIQCILEEILAESWKTIGQFGKLCASLLEHVVADNCDWWGICQPFAHLSSSRIGSGQLMLSSHFDQILPHFKTKTTDETKREKNIRQILLTTCVGSVEELEEMLLIGSNTLKKLWHGSSGNSLSNSHLCGASRSTGSSLSVITSFRKDMYWQTEAIHTLYHFMRCSQLEYIGQEGRSPIQVSHCIIDKNKYQRLLYI